MCGMSVVGSVWRALAQYDDRALAQYGVKGFFWISVVKLATPMLCKDPKKSREGCLLHLKKKTLRAKSWESIQLFWERGGNLGKIPAAGRG